MNTGHAVANGAEDLRELEARAIARCRAAIEARYPELGAMLPGAPTAPAEWFNRLAGVIHLDPGVEWLRRLAASNRSLRGDAMPAVEHYAVLQALLVALPRMAALPVHEETKRYFYALAAELAAPSSAWLRQLDVESPAFRELARIVTLRRFHAGQLSFDIGDIARSWLLKVHPLALPGIVREFHELGGFGPFAQPHLNYWRPNPLLMLKTESERSMWLIAKSVAQMPEIRGLAGASWLYAADVAANFPNLAWNREFFLERGAFIVDLEQAQLDSGFLVGSAKRRQMYQEGKFHPRRTLVLWRRRDMLEWAAQYNDIDAVGADSSPVATTRPRRHAPAYRADANKVFASGRITIYNCVRAINTHPARYFALAVILPIVIMTVLVSLVFGPAAAIPAMLLSIPLAWIAQYFLLQ